MSRTITPNKLSHLLGLHHDQFLHPVQGPESVNINIAIQAMSFKISCASNSVYLYISYQRKPSPWHIFLKVPYKKQDIYFLLFILKSLKHLGLKGPRWPKRTISVTTIITASYFWQCHLSGLVIMASWYFSLKQCICL